MFSIRSARPGDESAVHAIVSGVLAEYGLTLDPAGTDSDLDDLTASYHDRGGVFRVVVNSTGEIVGCGGLYRLSEAEAEIRKMYLRPEVRGRGLGRELLEDLVAFARRHHVGRLTLETASVLTRAIAMYQRFGFVEYTPGHLAERCDQAFEMNISPEAL